ncbi:hypothetical protein GCM10027049_24790 [Mucilaginibacter puniceus]
MKKITLLLLSALAFFQSNAQSLPKVQEKSVRAPANVRIDGKPTEWGDSFQAYNPTTELSYTMANDDKNLYIVVQANDARFFGVVSRIVARGITFNFVDNKVKDNKGISVTWPVKNIPDVRRYGSMNSSDTLLAGTNNSLEKRFRFITVSGVKDVDTIPVFNDLGIEASHKFDIKDNYTVELSVPLELIRSQINAAGKFSYKITINGQVIGGPIYGQAAIADAAKMGITMNANGQALNARPMGGNVVTVVRGNSGGNMSAPTPAPSNIPSGRDPRGTVLEYQSSTSFTGEYTLAK